MRPSYSKKNSNKYNWKFEYAGVPFDSEKGIIKLVENNDNKVMKYQYLRDEVTYCQFTLERLNDIQDQMVNFIELPKEEKINEINQKIEEIKQPFAIVKKGNIAYFKQQFGMYPPPTQQRFKHGDLVLCTLDPNYGYEGDRADNVINKKQETEFVIKDGYLYDGKSNLFSTDIPKKAFNDHGEFIWILDKKGSVFITTMYGEVSKAAIGNQHSFFLKKDGYGKTIAAGGHIKVREGKITGLDNSSGHYKPNLEQLLLAAHYLYKQGVLDENVVVQDHTLGKIYNLSDIVQINTQDISKKYSELV